MTNLLLKILEDTPSIDTTAVDQLFAWLQKILNTNLITIGGTTLTVGLLIVATIKFLFPKNKIIINQESTISQLEEENAALKETAVKQEARIKTLEEQMAVVVANTPNKKVQAAKDIKIDPASVVVISANVTKNTKKKVKVKVKKAVDTAVNTLESGVVSNG